MSIRDTDRHAQAAAQTEHEREAEKRELDRLAREVVGAAYEVMNTLGPGFLEKVYERALLVELGERSIRACAQAAMPVSYKGVGVGEYFADIAVEGKLLVELKCVDALSDEHLAQCVNYLKATGFRLCLLPNFGRSKVQFRRVMNRY